MEGPHAYPTGVQPQKHKKPMAVQNGSCWLTPSEQEEAIQWLIEDHLLEWDNKRSLKLKSGGFTDIYINLRLARNSPRAIGRLADLYTNPLRRLRVKRFVEVPDAISPVAANLSVMTGIPYITVREEAKEGRVVKGRIIGDPVRYGEEMAIIDDVVTDAASKIAALMELRSAGAVIKPLVVLVDRQQGWRQKLAEAGYGDVGVWSGMTLHDVRRFLVGKGLMRRCDPAVEEKNPIIVALDGKVWEDVLAVADPLRTTGCILKVNDLLWERGFDRLLPDLSVYGRVMADLKGHDISNTMENISKRLLRNPPWAVTVHGSGGEKMIKTVVDTLKGTPTKVLVVTVLTSIDTPTSEEIYHRLPLDQVETLAAIGNRAGAHGFVCSPQEVSRIRPLYPEKVFVTPGVRSPGADVGDQARVDTPANAIKNGATHLVMGRQILGAKDPFAEVNRVLRDELKLV